MGKVTLHPFCRSVDAAGLAGSDLASFPFILIIIIVVVDVLGGCYGETFRGALAATQLRRGSLEPSISPPAVAFSVRLTRICGVVCVSCPPLCRPWPLLSVHVGAFWASFIATPFFSPFPLVDVFGMAC